MISDSELQQALSNGMYQCLCYFRGEFVFNLCCFGFSFALPLHSSGWLLPASNLIQQPGNKSCYGKVEFLLKLSSAAQEEKDSNWIKGSFPSDEVTQVVLPGKGSQIYSFLALEKLPQRGKNICFPAPTHTSLHQQHWKYDNVCVNVYFRAQSVTRAGWCLSSH